MRVTNDPTNAIFNVQGTLSAGLLTEFKVGYNAPKADIHGVAPVVNGIDFGLLAFNLSGSIANTGIAGQSASSGIVVPGGLVRANSATNGRAAIYDPSSIAFANTTTLVRGNHLAKFGADVRLIGMTFDQQGGTTYSFANITAFLANQPSGIQYAGDISSPSVFNNGAAGMRETRQNYFVGFAQDEWKVSPHFTFNYGLRYDYYTPLTVKDDLFVKFNLDTGTLDPNTVDLHGTKKNSFQPRLAATYNAGKTVVRGGFGMFVGPGQGEDLIQPIESDRVNTTLSTGPLLAFPINTDALVANFTSNPNNRSYQPRAYAAEYNIPERVYQYTASVQREFGTGYAATAAYVGSQGRNLFLRSVGNQIIEVLTNSNPANAAFIVREFSLVERNAAGQITRVQNPYAEVDFKTSGGHDEYNAMMLSLNKRSANGLATNVQYTLGRSRGTSGGSNEANTAANNARTLDEFEYEDGYNNFDVRHTFNLSVLYSLPYGRGRKYGTDAGALTQALLGGWDVGGIINARSGLPVPVQIVRPDIVYQDATGNIFANPATGRTAIINVPGGGASRNVRRPDLIPGVDPFIKDGGLLFLNPAAFATPAPGTVGNLERNSIHGPELEAGRHVLRQALRHGRPEQRRVPRRSVQPVRHGQLRQPDRHAAAGDPDRGPQGGQPRAARSALHGGGGRHVRSPEQHRRPDRRPRHAASDPVRIPLLVLSCLCSAIPLLGACSEHAPSNLQNLRTLADQKAAREAAFCVYTRAVRGRGHARTQPSSLRYRRDGGARGVSRQHRRRAPYIVRQPLRVPVGRRCRPDVERLPRRGGRRPAQRRLRVGGGDGAGRGDRHSPAPHGIHDAGRRRPLGQRLRRQQDLRLRSPPAGPSGFVADLRRSRAVRPSAQLRAPAERPRAGDVPVGNRR